MARACCQTARAELEPSRAGESGLQQPRRDSSAFSQQTLAALGVAGSTETAHCDNPLLWPGPVAACEPPRPLSVRQRLLFRERWRGWSAGAARTPTRWLPPGHPRPGACAPSRAVLRHLGHGPGASPVTRWPHRPRSSSRVAGGTPRYDSRRARALPAARRPAQRGCLDPSRSRVDSQSVAVVEGANAG